MITSVSGRDGGGGSRVSKIQVSRSSQSIRPRPVHRHSVLGVIASVILGSGVDSWSVQGQVIPNSPTPSPTQGVNPVPGTLPPQPVKSEPPQVPIETPKVAPTGIPIIIDPRVEQRVPARSPDRDLLRVVPSQPGTSSDNELGILRQRQLTPAPTKAVPSATPAESGPPDSNEDLGQIIIRPKPAVSPPRPPARQPPRSPTPKSLYLTGRIDYFQNSNVLASFTPQSEGALKSTLSLYYAPALGPKTFLLATTEASLLRYGTLSRLNSDELRIKVGLYHQWTPKISTELGWSYYQLSAAPAGVQQSFQGKRFFNEHSLRVDVVRQDIWSPQVSLNTIYQLRWNLAGDVDRYDRLVNNAIVSLSYKLSPRTQAALDYQYSWTHFTQQTRTDQVHFLGTRLSHSVSDRVQLSAFGGRNFGTSTESRVNVTGWIFGVGLGFNVPIF